MRTKGLKEYCVVIDGKIVGEGFESIRSAKLYGAEASKRHTHCTVCIHDQNAGKIGLKLLTRRFQGEPVNSSRWIKHIQSLEQISNLPM